MPQAVELFNDARFISCKCSAAVVGGRFVKISATVDATDGNPVVAHAGAAEKVFGVAMFDAPINGFVTVARAPNVMPVTSGAAVAAGAEVESAAAGKAITLAAGKAAGTAINTVGAADATLYVALGG